jgi:hypothetical protein
LQGPPLRSRTSPLGVAGGEHPKRPGTASTSLRARARDRRRRRARPRRSDHAGGTSSVRSSWLSSGRRAS